MSNSRLFEILDEYRDLNTAVLTRANRIQQLGGKISSLMEGIKSLVENQTIKDLDELTEIIKRLSIVLEETSETLDGARGDHMVMADTTLKLINEVIKEEIKKKVVEGNCEET